MYGQLLRLDALARAALGDQQLGQGGVFARSYQPADDFAAEDVQHDVQAVPKTWQRAAQLGNIPTPDLARPRREQLGPGVGRMAPLGAPFLGRGISRQDAIHGTPGTPVAALV